MKEIKMLFWRRKSVNVVMLYSGREMCERVCLYVIMGHKVILGKF